MVIQQPSKMPSLMCHNYLNNNHFQYLFCYLHRRIQYVHYIVKHKGDLKMRLKQDRRVKFQLQLRHSFFIVIICHDVEVHEKNKGGVNTATHNLYHA